MTEYRAGESPVSGATAGSTALHRRIERVIEELDRLAREHDRRARAGDCTYHGARAKSYRFAARRLERALEGR